MGNLPQTPEALFEALDIATDHQKMFNSKEALRVSREEFERLASRREQEKIEKRWGNFAGEIVPMPDGSVFIGGIRFGNVFIGVQPRIGVQGDPMRLLFDKQNTPHHQYLAFYRWISRTFNADALIHVGMHGSVEWMPGLQLGMNRKCWSDALLGEVPHLYIYPVNNPSESSIAKRRGYATMVSHSIPPLSRSGLYKELPALRDMINDYRERNLKGDLNTEEAIMQKVEVLSLNDDVPRKDGEAFSDYVSRLYVYLNELESRLITNSLHIFGQAAPIETQIITVTESLKAQGLENALPSLLLKAFDHSNTFKHYAHLASVARKGEERAISLREKIDDACKTFVEHAVFGCHLPLGGTLIVIHVDHRLVEGGLLEDLIILGVGRLQPLGALAIDIKTGGHQIFGDKIRLIVFDFDSALRHQLNLAQLPGNQRNQKQQGKQQGLSAHTEASG